MEKEYVIINLVLSFCLFLINGFLGTVQYKYNNGIFEYGRFSFSSDKENNFAGNYAQKIINPSVFMAIVSGFFQSLQRSDICYTLWLMIPGYWLFFVLKILISQKREFVKLKYEIIAFGLSVLLAGFVYKIFLTPLLDSGEEIFMSLTEFRDAVWYAIIAYVAMSGWKIGKVFFSSADIDNDGIDTIVLKRYASFNEKFGNQVLNQISQSSLSRIEEKIEFISLVYAIMIYEDYNRPCLYRKAERFMKWLLPYREMTLGVMQVKTKKIITDEESVELAIRKMLIAYNKEGDSVYNVINDYNGTKSYYEEVSAIRARLDDLVAFESLFENTTQFERII